MLKIRQSQFDTLGNNRRETLKSRVDGWLLNELENWGHFDQDERMSTLGEIFDLADSSNMLSEMDYALFSRILLEHERGWKAFAADKEVQEVLNCKIRRSGAKVGELSALSQNSPRIVT